MWRETVEQVANMMVMDPYPGFQGKYFSMPVRNVMPKPVQKPHPPLWVACSNRETIHLAAQLGIGALTFAFIDPDEARHWVDDYYETFKRECVPIGTRSTPTSPWSRASRAIRTPRRPCAAASTASASSSSRSVTTTPFGKHTPGRTNIWKKFERCARSWIWTSSAAARAASALPPSSGVAAEVPGRGVDQTVFIQQGGKNQHEHICESLELFAKDVMPEFKEHEAKRLAEKAEELAPYIEAALTRKQYLEPLADTDIPVYEAFGSSIAQIDLATMPEANRRRIIAFMKMREIAERS
jgi:alkanesulfonate monooxygenase SsuD/methylene tetrahydromethanopterin reductase-like flavin-dependent oxidoreductase (luciferase family)